MSYDADTRREAHRAGRSIDQATREEPYMEDLLGVASSTESGLMTAADYVLLHSTLLPPLTVARTVYVSTLGNDTTGDGTVGLPWLTIAKAWTDRQKYGVLRAKYTVQLVGAGPYAWPPLGESLCDVSGRFVVQGDSAVDTVVASGTFTGDMSGFVIPTSVGLGSDTCKDAWLVISSGNCSGARVNIAFNTDTSITVAEKSFRTTLGAIANGDTFSVRIPGTVVTSATPASGQLDPGICDWRGGDALVSSTPPRHQFYWVQFTTGTLLIKDSTVVFVGCKFTNTFSMSRAQAALGFLANGSGLGVGADTDTNKLFGCGCVFTSTFILQGTSQAVGSAYHGGSVFVGSASVADAYIYNGGRINGALSVNGGRLEAYGSTAYVYVSKSISALHAGQIVLAGSTWLFAVTSGNCLRLRFGALLKITAGATITGGTGDAAGYGVDVAGGGRAWFSNSTPTLTGGTASADLHTMTQTKANSWLAATGDYLADPGIGECIARTA